MGVHVAAGAVKAGMCRDHVEVTRDGPNTGYPMLIACLTACLSPGDMVLVKGSRAMRMERIVECWKQQFPMARTKAR